MDYSNSLGHLSTRDRVFSRTFTTDFSPQGRAFTRAIRDVDNYFSPLNAYCAHQNECTVRTKNITVYTFLRILILTAHPESKLHLCVHVWIRAFIQVHVLKLK